MKEEIKELIEASGGMSLQKKTLYLTMLEYISEKEMEELLKILQEEAKTVSDIKIEEKAQTGQINEDFMEQGDQLFKDEEKKAIKKEEIEEDIESEKLLKDIEEL
ncbi:MAG: hypothetical protein O3B47_03290 [bacterium]|nr:hypothetical protein [bacterium]